MDSNCHEITNGTKLIRRVKCWRVANWSVWQSETISLFNAFATIKINTQNKKPLKCGHPRALRLMPNVNWIDFHSKKKKKISIQKWLCSLFSRLNFHGLQCQITNPMNLTQLAGNKMHGNKSIFALKMFTHKCLYQLLCA